jgi:2-iminobutanoate/2-iminopropanoate deaminase
MRTARSRISCKYGGLSARLFSDMDSILSRFGAATRPGVVQSLRDDPVAVPVGPHTPIVRAGEWLVVSGQIGAVDGQLVKGGVSAQVTQALTNMSAQLESQGAGLINVVKAMVFLTDMGNFATMNEAYVAAFGDHRPARSALAVVGLPMGADVEIEAWAWVGG